MSLQTRLSDLITSIGTDYKTLRTMIAGSPTGTLSALNTTSKTSLISAINEISSGINGGSSFIYLIDGEPFFDPEGGPGSSDIVIVDGYPYIDIGA